MQFLVETVLLSSVGGVMGVALGVTLPFIVSQVFDLETIISWWSVFLAFGISVGIGIVFGIYPARRAAMMNPIEAFATNERPADPHAVNGFLPEWPAGPAGRRTVSGMLGKTRRTRRGPASHSGTATSDGSFGAKPWHTSKGP